MDNSIKARFLGVLTVLAAMAVLFTVGIYTMGEAADKTWVTNVGHGQTATYKALDVGSYSAPAVIGVARDYRELIFEGAVTADTNIIFIDLGDTVNWPHSYDGSTVLTSHILFSDIDWTLCLDDSTARFTLSLGELVMQDGNTGRVWEFYKTSVYGQGCESMRRPYSACGHEWSGELTGNTPDNYMVNQTNSVLSGGSYAAASSLYTATLSPLTASPAVGDIIMKMDKISGGAVTLTGYIRMQYRTE